MTDPQSPPSLTIVEDPVAAPESTPAATRPAPPPASRTRTWLVWLLLAAAVLFAWQWISTLQRAEAAETRVVALEGELGAARAELAAWQGHMAAVRSAVQSVAVGIAEQLGSLQALVDEAPDAPQPPARAEASETP